MTNLDEGYIKFDINWAREAFDFDQKIFEQINSCRKELFDLNLIGAYPNGIGFGNISSRTSNSEFIISGSATGNISDLKLSDYSLVRDFDIVKNKVDCIGLTKASSESMSHAIIYQSNPLINTVIHIHHFKMWDKYIDILPTTSRNAKFGTPDIAFEIKKLVKSNSGIIIMGGHQEGVIAYGENLIETKKILLTYYNKI